VTNRIHIDAPTGVIEVEGEKEFVEAQLDKLLPLIEACGFGTRSSKDEAGNESQSDDPNTISKVDAEIPLSDQASAKKPRRRRTRAPKGQSCADRIMVLRNEGFFKEQKSNADIVNGLGKKGWIYKANQVAAATGPMFERGDLQRTSVGKGFGYFWDRD